MRGGGGGRGERERERVGVGVKNWPWKIHLFFFAGGRNVQRFCALGSVAEVRDLLSEPLTHQHLLDAVGRRRLETETWDVAVAHVPHFLLIHSNMCRFVFLSFLSTRFKSVRPNSMHPIPHHHLLLLLLLLFFLLLLLHRLRHSCQLMSICVIHCQDSVHSSRWNQSAIICLFITF